MKRALRALARRLWRLAGPVRRPLAAKVEGRAHHLVREALRQESAESQHAIAAALAQTTDVVNVARRESFHHRVETNLALDGLIREVARLQLQVETLQQLVEELRDPAGVALADSVPESRRLAG